MRSNLPEGAIDLDQPEPPNPDAADRAFGPERSALNAAADESAEQDAIRDYAAEAEAWAEAHDLNRHRSNECAAERIGTGFGQWRNVR